MTKFKKGDIAYCLRDCKSEESEFGDGCSFKKGEVVTVDVGSKSETIHSTYRDTHIGLLGCSWVIKAEYFSLDPPKSYPIY